mgnify:CR=1 FL=1
MAKLGRYPSAYAPTRGPPVSRLRQSIILAAFTFMALVFAGPILVVLVDIFFVPDGLDAAIDRLAPGDDAAVLAVKRDPD